MKRGLVIAGVLTGVVFAIGGWAYFTTTANTTDGDGWHLLAAEAGAPWTRIPDEPRFAEVITNEAGLTAVWSVLQLADDPPDVDFGSSVVLRVTAFGSGSCPLHFDKVTFHADRVVASASTGLVLQCSNDSVPYTFVLVTDRERLPPVPFKAVVVADSVARESTITAVK